MEMNPLISVVIPVYNPGKYFDKCLQSIINQTYKNLEIILVDDGSTDGSGEKCDVYAKKDDRIKVFHQQNSGVSKARNVGISNSNGDYYHFPDSDDYIELNTYEYLLDLIRETQCDVINFEHFITFNDREIIHSYNADFYGRCDKHEALKKMAGGVQFCWNKLFSKKFITANGDFAGIRFMEEIARGEDVLFAAMVIDRTNSVWFDDRPLYHYVQTEESACRGHFRMSQLSITMLYDYFKPIYGQYDDVWNAFLVHEQGTLISIYYDMWADKVEQGIQESFLKVIKEHFCEIKSINGISRKARFKFHLFNCSPTMFCLIHKMNVKRLSR